MFFSSEMIHAAEAHYGSPLQLRLNYPTPQAHFDFIRSTQRDGRAHDVTLYLYHKDRLAVTRKAPYPEGAYRPPSGGLHLGESLEEGARREAFEELGIEIELEKYLLRVWVDFVSGSERILWTTHVFRARYTGSGEPKLDPQDRHEIAEAVWAGEEEYFQTMRPGLLAMGSTGLLYRAHLQDYVWRNFGWR